MYLSKAAISIDVAIGRRCLWDYQLMHERIQDLYQCTRQEGQILYRVNLKTATVYILSNRYPVKKCNEALSVLVSRNMEIFEKRFIVGQVYQFDLLTEPFKKVGSEEQKNSQRRALKTMDERLAWHQRKGEQNGYQILQATEYPAMPIRGNHRKAKGGTFQYYPTRMMGTLKITDVFHFLEGWKNGIGAGKSYGIGFLLLK